MRRLTLTLGMTAGLGLFLPGCETMPKPVKVDFAEARPAPLPMVAVVVIVVLLCINRRHHSLPPTIDRVVVVDVVFN